MVKPKVRQPKSFKRMVHDLAETLADEAREHARKLGLRGPNLMQQVKDEIAWWKEIKGMDYFERKARPATPNWRRVRALHGIETALDVLAEEGVGPLDMWIELVDDYLPEMRRFAAVAASGPGRCEMRRFSAILRERERVKSLEAEAQSKIDAITKGFEQAKRLACAA
jgi:hypothetical protein